jgi:hypothetical protein
MNNVRLILFFLALIIINNCDSIRINGNKNIISSEQLLNQVKEKGLSSFKKHYTPIHLARLGDSCRALQLAYIDIDSGLIYNYGTIHLAQVIKDKKLGEGLFNYFKKLSRDIDQLKKDDSEYKVKYDEELIKALVFQTPKGINDYFITEHKKWDSLSKLETTYISKEYINDKKSIIAWGLMKLNHSDSSSIIKNELKQLDEFNQQMFFSRMHNIEFYIFSEDTAIIDTDYSSFEAFLLDSINLAKSIKSILCFRSGTNKLIIKPENIKVIEYPIIYYEKRAIISIHGPAYTITYLAEMISKHKIKYSVISQTIY